MQRAARQIRPPRMTQLLRVCWRRRVSKAAQPPRGLCRLDGAACMERGASVFVPDWLCGQARSSPALLFPRPLSAVPRPSAVAAAMRSGLPSTVVVELLPGASFGQTTHALLLRGQLAALPPARQAGATAPAVLPWLFDEQPGQALTPRLGVRRRELDSRMWWAGPDGALLLVWLTPEGGEPPGVAEAAQAARSLAAPAQQEALNGDDEARLQPASGSGGGSSARRLMPWQHPFVRRRPAQ